MIDIHTHILPGIDDGSQTMSDSIRMAQIAADSGVDALIVTPHCNIEGLYENYYDDALVKRFRALETMIKEEKIPLDLYLGMEIYGTEEVPELLRKGRLVTLNQSRYLLLEFSFRKDLLLIDFIISEIKEQGYIPVIAHPERYPFVQKHPDIVYQWIDQGCAIQINKGSILGNFGFSARNTALYLLEYHLVSFIASDAHSPLQRTTDLSRVYQYIKSKYSEKYTEILFKENPRRVIEDKDLIKTRQMRELERTYYI